MFKEFSVKLGITIHDMILKNSGLLGASLCGALSTIAPSSKLPLPPRRQHLSPFQSPRSIVKLRIWLWFSSFFIFCADTQLWFTVGCSLLGVAAFLSQSLGLAGWPAFGWMPNGIFWDVLFGQITRSCETRDSSCVLKRKKQENAKQTYRSSDVCRKIEIPYHSYSVHSLLCSYQATSWQ